MTASNDLDRLVASWLETDGPSNVRTEVVDTAFDTARGLRQRRGPSAWFAGPGSWPVYAGRLSLRGMSPAVRLGIAIMVLLALIVGSVTVGSQLLQDADPVTPSTRYDGTFESVGGESRISDGPTAVAILPDGRVLASGISEHGLGLELPTRIEAWDPSTGTVIDLGATLTPREGATVVALRDGRVLVLGGDLPPEGPVTAEMFDPATGTSTPIGTMPGAPQGFTAALLPDGRVLLAGGASADAAIYDPATNSLSPTQPMTRGIAGSLGVTHLPDDRLLLVELVDRPGVATANIESFDPATGSFSSVGELTQPPSAPGVLLADGRVLFAHGSCSIDFPSDHPGGATIGIEPVSTEIFDPADGSLTAGPALPHCVDTATALPDGSVLVTGAWGEGGPWQLQASSDSMRIPDRTTVSWAGLLDPRSGSVRMVDPPDRSGAIPTVLASGDVLFVGGRPGGPQGRGLIRPVTWGEIFR